MFKNNDNHKLFDCTSFFFEQTTYLDYRPAQYKGEEEPLQSAGFTRESSMEFWALGIKENKISSKLENMNSTSIRRPKSSIGYIFELIALIST